MTLDLPAVGFGTYKLNGLAGVETIRSALDVGYRVLDSAMNYENEGAVGAAVRTSSVPRDEIVVTSKLPGRHHGYEQAITSIEESLLRTGLDHLDLHLIHWPNPSRGLYVEAWQALIDARRRGLVREIGVCNFLPEHLDRLEAETGVLPAVNQIEVHPYFPQVGALADHRARGIVTQAWSPLGRKSDLLTNPVVTEVAHQHGVTPAEAVLAWHAAVGTLPLPKASTAERQRQNLAAVEIELDPAAVDRLTALGRPDGRLFDGDPAVWIED
ncbi:aldo/keto reductase [Aeromicrobium sp. 636]|uniref:Aldo/keto reductase n=1 Tax=Aeromicrobium senzhongii TaxID=2663859 RepID=A0A8I0ET15_9ACTN|nr:aldo/keto reductase [Aeromicrobium sp. 636]MBC9225093.1 aldo/keto reductase [Aeromicrobium senzhongii]MCQ3997203.1 aldo/keto reductase [Aeromicrobium sp. 636]